MQSLWMVVRTDGAGNTFMVRDELTKEDAVALVLQLESHGHKQDYHCYSYTKESRASLVGRYSIFE